MTPSMTRRARELGTDQPACWPSSWPAIAGAGANDKRRKNKQVSNDDWVLKTDPEARITQLKDGRTHLAYKAEHVVDLESDLILAAEIRPADHGDS